MVLLSPYHGSEPYIFISYAHKDSAVVLPILQRMQESGFRVWYDEGIQGGTEWPEFIAMKLFACNCVVVFISRNSVNSKNCRREINFAIDKDKPLLVIYLDDGELPLGMQLQLNTLQALSCLTADAMEGLIQKMNTTELLQLAKGAPVAQSSDVQVTIPEPQPQPMSFRPEPVVIPKTTIQIPKLELQTPASTSVSGWKCICGKAHTAAEQACSCGNWRCACGRVHIGYVSSCICGQKKMVTAQKTGGSWSCTCGRVHMAYVSTCICGQKKSNLT